MYTFYVRFSCVFSIVYSRVPSFSIVFYHCERILISTPEVQSHVWRCWIIGIILNCRGTAKLKIFNTYCFRNNHRNQGQIEIIFQNIPHDHSNMQHCNKHPLKSSHLSWVVSSLQNALISDAETNKYTKWWFPLLLPTYLPTHLPTYLSTYLTT